MDGFKVLDMKRNELLKLPVGIYLLTDEICNYKYLLYRHNDDKLIAHIYNLDSFKSPIISTCIAVFYDYKNDKHRKTLHCILNLGGIFLHDEFYSKLINLHLVGIYNKNNVIEDLKRFKKNYKINLNPYLKKGLVK